MSQASKLGLGAAAAMLVVWGVAGWTPVAGQTAPCRFVQGFADLRQAVGAGSVGECLQDEYQDPVSGDTRQATTRGELVYRRASNTAAFTNGYETWVMGPNGLQRRLNSERFAWEPDAASFARAGEGTPTTSAARPSLTRPTAPPLASPAASPGLAASPTPTRTPTPASTPGTAGTVAPSGGPVPAPLATAPVVEVSSTASPTASPPTPPSTTQAVGAGVAPISRNECPSSHPIKASRSGGDPGRAGTGIYYAPASGPYLAVDAEICFATAADAEAAGFRPPNR